MLQHRMLLITLTTQQIKLKNNPIKIFYTNNLTLRVSKFRPLGYYALHAQSLEFIYKGVPYKFTSPLDAKMQAIIDSSILAPQDHKLNA